MRTDPNSGGQWINTYDKDGNHVFSGKTDGDGNMLSSEVTEIFPEGGSKVTDTDHRTGVVSQFLHNDEGILVYSEKKDSDGVVINSYERAPDGSRVHTRTDPDSGVQYISTFDSANTNVFTERRDGDGTKLSSETKNNWGKVISTFKRAPDGSTVETRIDPDSGTQWAVTKDKDGNIIKRETNDPNDSLGEDEDELK